MLSFSVSSPSHLLPSISLLASLLPHARPLAPSEMEVQSMYHPSPMVFTHLYPTANEGIGEEVRMENLSARVGRTRRSIWNGHFERSMEEKRHDGAPLWPFRSRSLFLIVFLSSGRSSFVSNQAALFSSLQPSRFL